MVTVEPISAVPATVGVLLAVALAPIDSVGAIGAVASVVLTLSMPKPGPMLTSSRLLEL
ncbi:hypothetical protein [Methylobacterium gnaphalii]|uniref:Uncharacterized protein n=1 Tax=Methylobacterium gnaphalii TaxID=1010610 RepID=A0A512JHJ6_9HYPH|nr:hypothetical protein [Methylobacterium gnaphalii]GEP09342.1 hypothetical protein MGN01_11870 [Methylobacterium gnaphalii]GLS51652.1 hypothetical protein GCM10007885_45110 [Methylobacterium gnaphalii]